MTNVRDRRIFFIILVTIIFARSIGGRVPFFMTYTAVLLAGLCYLWAVYGLQNLTCTYYVDRRHLIAGDPLNIRIRLYNEWFLPIPWAEITDHSLIGKEPIKAVTSISMVGSKVIQYTVPRIRRGLYRLGPVTVKTGDVFGLFESSREVYSDVTVLVLPRLLDIPGLTIPPRQPFGHQRTKQRAFEDPSNLAEVRPFRPGDHKKMVHWRTTARKGELHTKEYELTATSEVYVLCDLNRSAYGPDPDQAAISEDTAIEATAGIVHHALSISHDVTFTGYGSSRLHLRLGRGRRHFNEFMELLARATASGDISITEQLLREAQNLSARSSIIVVSPQMDHHLAATLARLKRMGFGMVSVTIAKPDPEHDWQSTFHNINIPAYRVTPGMTSNTAGDDIAS